MGRKESNQTKQNFEFVLLYMRRIVHSCLSLPHCYRLACFYLIYDPRVNPARIQPRATVAPPAKRHSDGVSLTDR